MCIKQKESGMLTYTVSNAIDAKKHLLNIHQYTLGENHKWQWAIHH